MGFGNGNTNRGSSDGLFFDTVEITRTRPYYEEKPEWASKPFDLALEAFYNVTTSKGTTFENSVLIKVHPKKDDLGRVQSIPDGFKIDRLFEKAGAEVPEPTEDNRIPEDALRDLVGREIRVLSYRNTRSTADKLRTSTWDIVGRADGSDDQYMRDEFLKQAAKGWPKNYLQGAPAASEGDGLPFQPSVAPPF